MHALSPYDMELFAWDDNLVKSKQLTSKHQHNLY